MTYFHPSIVSDKLVPTINFYEDYFDFIPVIEEAGFTLLRRLGKSDERIAIYDAAHKCVEGRVQLVRGVILNMAVDDVQAAYDALYMEGLEIYKEPGTDIHGRKHFVVYDPNGILVNVHEAVDVAPPMELA